VSAHAALVLELLRADPKAFGGIWLRGDPLRAEKLLDGWTLRRLPLGIDGDRLSGGLDLAASLSEGRAVHRDGLLVEAWGECLLVSGPERMPDVLAARLAQARDEGGPALVLLDEGREAEVRPPACLLDRVAFHVDMAGEPCPGEASGNDVVEDGMMAALAHAADAFGVASPRALIFAMRTVRALARLDGDGPATTRHLAEAAALVLAPRATRMPEASPEPGPEPEPDQQREAGSEQRLDDLVVDAVRVALPADLIESLARGLQRGGRDRSHGSGARRVGTRGRPIGARQAMPRSGVRLALVETLRAAAPWQRLRAGGRRTPGCACARRICTFDVTRIAGRR
jgi:magnesium chelatase subunit D